MKHDYLKHLGFTIEGDRCIMCSIFRLSAINLNKSTMSNLSKETRDRIEADALKYAEQIPDCLPHISYRRGALTEAGRAEVLTEFIEYVINFPPAMSKSAMSEWVEEVRNWARTALAKYKEVVNAD